MRHKPMIYKGKEYSVKPVNANTKDVEGREYYTRFSNKLNNGVLSYKGKNFVFSGNPKVGIRFGDSVHGEEILFQLLIHEMIEKNPQKSPHNVMEIYLKLDDGAGVQFLKDCVKYFEEIMEKKRWEKS